MKTLIASLLITATAITAQAGPSWGFALSNGAGFYYGGGQQRQQSRSYYCQPQTAYVVGPQYYISQQQTSYYPVQQQYRNYTGVPVVVRQQCGGSVIVPNSWR